MIKLLLIDIRNYFQLLLFKKKWRKANEHNYTIPVSKFPMENVKVGKYTYGDLRVRCYNNTNKKLYIGSFCSIASNVTFMLSGEHPYDRISTYPFKYYFKKINESDGITKGDIIIKDDVWIGEGCIILSGITIEQGAIIAAGSIVTKDVPPYSIYAGNRIIKKRFDENIINRLVCFDYNKLTKDKIHENFNLITSALNQSVFETSFFKWSSNSK